MKPKQKRFLGAMLCLAVGALAPGPGPFRMARAQDAPAAQPEAARSIPLALSTMGGTWFVQGDFVGSVRVEEGKLSFHFDTARLKLRDGVPEGTKRQIVNVRPLLRPLQKNPDNTFGIAGQGTPTAIGKELGTGQVLELGALDSTLAFDRGLDLSKHSFNLEILMNRTMPDGTTGISTVYIPSPDDIFAPRR